MAEQQEPKIITNPDIMLGKPVIAGTRITVEHVLREMAAGSSIADLLAMHSHLTREQIVAALAYAADAMGATHSAAQP
jgi:uncharacterized protein (DUF433 family)